MNIKQLIPHLLKDVGLQFETEYRFHPSRKWRFDFAIVDQKIAIEYEGIIASKSRHTSISGFTKDCEKYNHAAVLGWRIIRFTVLTNPDDLLYILLKIKDQK